MNFFSNIKLKKLNLLILVCFLIPFLYEFCIYVFFPFFFSTRDSYFSQFMLYTIKNCYFYLWLLILFVLIKWNSFISFINNFIHLLTKDTYPKNISEHKDGYLSDEDFGKKTFAHNILQIIDNFHKDEHRTKNLVIGLDGKWGDGKTYVIKKMKEILDTDQFSNFHLFHFQPWLFAQNTNYTNAFIDKLNTELIKFKCGVSLFYLSAFKDILDSSCGYWGRFISFFTNKTDDELKNIIQYKINQSQKQFIVILDDLDRLEAKEILQIFKLIRCIANFENLYFIVCLDRNVVESNIKQYLEQTSNNSPDGIRHKYCDKIINIYFEVPTITSEDLMLLFNKLIDQDSELKKWKQKPDETLYEGMLNSIGKFYYPQNVRDVKIIVNKLKALSILTYKNLLDKEELLSEHTSFTIFAILELIKLKNCTLYNNIKNLTLWNEPPLSIPDPEERQTLSQLAHILKQINNQHFYFAYNSGDLPITHKEYKQILKNISKTKLVQLQNKRQLISFLSHAISDKELSSEQFTSIVSNYEFLRTSSKEFNILFCKHFSLLNCKEYFRTDYSELSSLYTYELINLSENLKKRKEYIDAFINAYNTNPAYLPMNDLIFYLDFSNYTPDLFGILFQKILEKNIKSSLGLWKLLDKFIIQTKGNTSLFDMKIFSKYCTNTDNAINKFSNDCALAELHLKQDIANEENSDNYYPNIIKAYNLLIDFLKKHKNKDLT